MPASIGVNLRVTGYCSQGGRKYMEDFFSVAYQQSEDKKDLEFAFIGIYDGHGGSEAATFAKEHLINLIVNQKLFWSENDDDILRAIRNGYIATHWAMWREQEKWPKTASGLPSTAGTTASIAFIRHGKIYIGHAGDSGIVLGYTEDNDKTWRARALTQDHKPESNIEKERIENSGGKVVIKSGVPRVVWNRPRLGHKGPVRRSTPIDEIPFLAVARSLGDLWSYNSALNEFVVSPEPDVRVLKIDPKKHRCLVFGTDGLWNVLSPCRTVDIVRYAEQVNDRNALAGEDKEWINPSKCLVDKALERWSKTRMRADNTSVVILMLDPPGPPGRPKRDGLRSSTDQMPVDPFEYGGDGEDKNFTMYDHSTKAIVDLDSTPMPTSGLQIMVKYDNIDTGDFDVDMNKPEYSAPVASCSIADLSYMTSFAESYNSLLNSSSFNDHSYDPYPSAHLHDTSHQSYDETYSLTKLQTRSEQFGLKSIYDEPSTSSIYSNYQDRQHLERPQYDCISSSHLYQQPNDIGTRIDEPSSSSFQMQTNVLFENVIETNTDMNETAKELWATDEAEYTPQVVNPSDPIVSSLLQVDACSSSDTTNATADILDQTIQINEISSSSKDNDEKTCKNCATLQQTAATNAKDEGDEKETKDSTVVSEIDQQESCQRVTRSQYNNLLNVNMANIKKKVERQNLRNLNSKMLKLFKRNPANRDKTAEEKLIQNENFILKSQRRSQIIPAPNNSIDISNRTLRSMNSIAKTVSNGKPTRECSSVTTKRSTTLLSLTSKIKFKANSLSVVGSKTKINQKVQINANAAERFNRWDKQTVRNPIRMLRDKTKQKYNPNVSTNKTSSSSAAKTSLKSMTRSNISLRRSTWLTINGSGKPSAVATASTGCGSVVSSGGITRSKSQQQKQK